jgi:type I restriction enzyme S subunit
MIATEVNYKKTGIDWMPEVPEHWEIVRLKNVTKIVSGATPKSSVSANWDGNINWVTPAEFGDEMYIGESVRKITKTGLESCAASLVPIGSIILSSRAPIGSLGITNVELCTNQGCRSIVPFDVNNYFLYFLLLIQKANLNVLGNGTTFRELGTDSLKNYKIPLPPKEEQDRIANHLFEENEKITHFIQTKQRFIELLKEQRQSIITNAVTKGLNCDSGDFSDSKKNQTNHINHKNPVQDKVKMKQTVLGEIPEHWEVRRLGTIGRFSKGGNISRSELIYSDEGVPAILYGDLYTKYDIVAENIINRITKETAAKSVEIKKGDLLFTGSGETKEDIGKCVIFNSDEPAYAGGDVIIFKQDIFDSYFISYSQNSSIAKYQKAISSKGEIIVHTYGSKLRDVIMPYPPTIEEQKQIVEHIKTETRTLDIAISKAEREIELIKEYREAMIAEAVTGQSEL